MNTEIYEMQLHDDIVINPYLTVSRVPGGWIYVTLTHTGDGRIMSSSVFVPFNNEFQEG